MSRTNVLVIGDSLVYGYGLKEKDRWVNIISSQLDFNLINLSVSGSTVQDVKRQYENNDHNKVDLVIIGFGLNDVAKMMDKYGVLDFEILEKQLKDFLLVFACSSIPVLYVSVHPVNEESYYQRHPQKMYKKIGINESLKLFNDWISIQLKSYGVGIVDLYNDRTFQNRPEYLLKVDENGFEDGVHYSKKGSKFVASRVLEKLEEQL